MFGAEASKLPDRTLILNPSKEIMQGTIAIELGTTESFTRSRMKWYRYLLWRSPIAVKCMNREGELVSPAARAIDLIGKRAIDRSYNWIRLHVRERLRRLNENRDRSYN